jgi:hypothetical protein
VRSPSVFRFTSVCGRHPVGKAFFKSSSWSGAPVCTTCLRDANTAGLHALRKISSLSKARALGAWGQLGLADPRWSTAHCMIRQMTFPTCASGRDPKSLCSFQRGFAIDLLRCHERPSHAGHLICQRDDGRLCRPARQQLDEPGAACSVTLCVTHDSHCTRHQQPPQVAITAFGDTAQALLAAT